MENLDKEVEGGEEVEIGVGEEAGGEAVEDSEIMKIGRTQTISTIILVIIMISLVVIIVLETMMKIDLMIKKKIVKIIYGMQIMITMFRKINHNKVII